MKEKPIKNTKVRIALWKSFFVVVLVAVVFNFLWLMPELNNIRDRIYDNQSEITEKVESDLRFLLVNRAKTVIDELSIFPFVKDILLKKENFDKSQVFDFLSNKDDLVEFSVIDLNGKELLKVKNGVLQNKSNLSVVFKEPFFQQTQKKGFFVGVAHDKKGKNHNMIAAKKVSFFDGEGGVVYVKMDMKKEVKGYAKRLKDFEGELVYIVDVFGFVIDHYNEKLIGKNLINIPIIKEAVNSSSFDDNEGIKEFHDENEYLKADVYYDDDGKKIQATIRFLDYLGLAIVTEEPYDVAWGPWRNIFILSVLGISIFGIVAVLLIRNGIAMIRFSEQLKREKKQTETIVSNLVSGVILYDTDFKIMLINPRAREILGIKNEDVLGRKITPGLAKNYPQFDSLVKVLYPSLSDNVRRIPTEEGKPKIVEMRITHPYDMDIQVFTVPIHDHNKNVTGYLKIIRDVSREKAISRTKSEFISIAAHQLRTPLSAIKWIFKMLLDGDAGKLTEEQKDLLQKGYDSNERIIQLVNDMLNVARIEEGRFGYEFYYIDIVELINKVILEYKLKAEEKNIDLKFIKPSGKINPVKIDPSKIELVLQNLIDNALKYTKEGGSVEISLKKTDDYLQISVKDTGVGIPESQKERLFSKFFRGENVVKMQTEGTGLGLFITKNIVLRHGGKIWVDTKEGEGTTFTFTIPKKESLIPEKENNFIDRI